MRPVKFLFLATSILLNACENDTPAPQPQYSATPAPLSRVQYRFAVHPLHNPDMLSKAYQPLIDYLNQQIPEAHFELEASRDYQAYEVKFRQREPEFLLPNPWHTLQAIQVGYHVIAMAGEAEDFKGIFLARKDSPIKNPVDLKGAVVSYPSYTALAACIMPQYYLYQHGLDVNRDIQNIYVGSQESSIMNAYLKQSAVAATWPPPWRLFQRTHPQEAAELTVIWQTEPLINNSVMVRDDVDSKTAAEVRDLLLGLKQAPQGETILNQMETAAFFPADDASYDVVKNYVARFEKQVRPVEAP